jgi:hypothetical protein
MTVDEVRRAVDRIAVPGRSVVRDAALLFTDDRDLGRARLQPLADQLLARHVVRSDEIGASFFRGRDRGAVALHHERRGFSRDVERDRSQPRELHARSLLRFDVR